MLTSRRIKQIGMKRIGAAGSVCLAKPGVPYGTRHPVNFGGLSWDATTIITQEASYPG
jgi:hypothetical protein